MDSEQDERGELEDQCPEAQEYYGERQCPSTLWIGEHEFWCCKAEGHAGAHSIIGYANGCDYFIRWRERGEDEPQNTW